MLQLVPTQYLIWLRAVVLSLVLVLPCGGAYAADTKPDAAVTGQELDEELLYQLMAGELAGVRGQLDEAVDYYLDAAELTSDPRVAARAAHIASFAQRYHKALEATERWQQLATDDRPVIRLRILAYLMLEQVENTVSQIDQLLLEDGQVNNATVSTLGRLLQQSPSPDVVLNVLHELNQRHPNNLRLLLLQARTQVRHSYFDNAMLSIEQVIRLDNSVSDAYLIRAQILAAQDREDEAVKSIAIAVDKRPDDNRLRMQFARMLVQMKSFDAALGHFVQLRKNMPDNEDVLLSLGLLSIETGNIDEAKQYLQELIDKGFHNDQAHYYLGRIQQNQGEWMPAIVNFERVNDKALAVDARIRTAGLLSRVGRVDDALTQLKQLIKQGQNNNDRIRVHLAQGEVLNSASRNHEAIKVYSNALQSSPENTDLLYARALTAEKLKMLDMAESDLRMVLAHEPENANALNALGYTLADRSDRLQEAKEYILKAAKLLPDDPAVLDSLGWVYYRLGKLEDAIKWLQKAFVMLQDAEISAHLGEVLWVSGQLDEAKKIWQRGLQVTPDHAILLQTMKRYNQ